MTHAQHKFDLKEQGETIYCENCEQRKNTNGFKYCCSICYKNYCEGCFFSEIYGNEMCEQCLECIHNI